MEAIKYVIALLSGLVVGYLMGIILMEPIREVRLPKWQLVFLYLAISLLCFDILSLGLCYPVFTGFILGIYQSWRKKQKAESDCLNYGIDRNFAKSSAMRFVTNLSICWGVCFLLFNLWGFFIIVLSVKR
jgi:hypothetical protein